MLEKKEKLTMDLNTYQEKAVSTAIYCKTDQQIEEEFGHLSSFSLLQVIKKYNKLLRLAYVALGLNGEAGEVAEKVKKLIRDKDGVIDQEFVASIKKEQGDGLWYQANLSNELDLQLDDIAQANIDKLKSRQERGVLGGYGDDR